MSLKLCKVRCMPRKFAVSFVVPDRVAAEICDGKRIKGKHPLRITRIPSASGKPSEFHSIISEAKKWSTPLRKTNGGAACISTKNHMKAYHRNRLNDWDVEVIYFEERSHDFVNQ